MICRSSYTVNSSSDKERVQTQTNLPGAQKASRYPSLAYVISIPNFMFSREFEDLSEVLVAPKTLKNHNSP